MASVEISLSDDIKKMTDLLGQFKDAVKTKVIRRALSKTGSRARTETVRAIKAEYKLASRVVRKGLKVRVGSGENLEVVLNMSGRPLPLYAFKPRAYGGPSGWPTRALRGKKRRPGGISVMLKGRRIKVPHAFIATMKSGHVGVFARGSYGKVTAATGETWGGRFRFATGRLPVSELYTFGLPQAFKNEKVLRQVVQRARGEFPKLLAHEIEWQLMRSKK